MGAGTSDCICIASTCRCCMLAFLLLPVVGAFIPALSEQRSTEYPKCTFHNDTGVSNGDDVAKPQTFASAADCAIACEHTPRCCIGLWNSKNHQCYLKWGGSLFRPGGLKGITAFTCQGGMCTTPAPGPPAPPKPSPSPAPHPFFNTSAMVGAMYTPWRAGNQFWWHRYDDHRADVVKEVRIMSQLLGFTAVRVFLHDILFDLDPKGLLLHMDDFLDILHAQGMRAGFVFFDDCWQHSNATINGTCGASAPTEGCCQPQQGLHNGCWFAAPQDSKRTAGVAQFEGYVSQIVQKFGNDSRVAWFEIFNEPQKHNPFSMALRDAGFRWATAQRPRAPVISCWDDSNNTEVVDTHEYSVPNDRSPVFSNPGKGGIVTEAGARFFQHTHDYGTPMAWLHWLTRIREHQSKAPFAPGVMLSWEVMVGHSNTRWHWTSKPGDPEPAIPWCGFLYPDGTPVSFTEAAALRRYTTGKDDFVFLAQNKSNPATPYILVNTLGWTGWAGDASSAPRLFELTLWPDSMTGNITVSVGGVDIVIDAVPQPFDCDVGREVGCYLDQMHARVLPLAVGSTAVMTHEICGAFCAAANVSGQGDLCGVEYGEQCWGGKLSPHAQKVSEDKCAAMPCGGNRSQECGGPYLIQVFQPHCTRAPASPVRMTLRHASATIATVDVGGRLVSAAWNMLRVLIANGRVRVWLNPNFADVTGASVPPVDERRAPRAPAPLIDTHVDIFRGGGSAGLSARASTGQWRIDYASVLPQPASFETR